MYFTKSLYTLKTLIFYKRDNMMIMETKLIKKHIIKSLKSTERENIEILIDVMKDYDYFTKPASLIHHENYTYGLSIHSKRDEECFEKITSTYNLIQNNKDKRKQHFHDSSLYICSYCHDLCKMLEYKLNDYNEWVRNHDAPKGHASISLAILNKCAVPLTEEEKFIIKYHMGQYHTYEYSKYGEYSTQDMFNAINKYPTVQFFQTADFLASHWNDKLIDNFIPK